MAHDNIDSKQPTDQQQTIRNCYLCSHWETVPPGNVPYPDQSTSFEWSWGLCNRCYNTDADQLFEEWKKLELDVPEKATAHLREERKGLKDKSKHPKPDRHVKCESASQDQISQRNPPSAHDKHVSKSHAMELRPRNYDGKVSQSKQAKGRF